MSQSIPSSAPTTKGVFGLKSRFEGVDLR